MRIVGAIGMGLVLAVLVVGLALYPMLHPTYTKLLSQRYSMVQESGLSQARVLSLAEQVRQFVSDSEVDTLPVTVDGRPGFDAAAVSHLRDVRSVFAGARTATGILAVIVVVWLGVLMARRRIREVGIAMLWAAGFDAAIVVLGGLAGFANFDALFAWFHGLFFSAGTWQFPADSLLIEIFPTGFWVACGVTWAALILLGAVILGVGGWLVRANVRRPEGQNASV
jgi:integral membrane protein (TIGR01906 family)